MEKNDPFNLQRFLDAQGRDYEYALREIRNGLKQSHWIWYIFPQLKGFGHSYNSEYYGIDGIEEALAYYNHPILGSRLVEITTALLEHRDKSIQEILPPIDARKVKSCMTLFWMATQNPLFTKVIDIFYESRMDDKTLKRCSITNNEKPHNEISMNHNGNPFKVEHLDFMIVDRGIRYTPNGRFTEDDGKVITLYNLFGRWFSKQFIIERINYINETSRKEGRHMPAYMAEGGFFQNAIKELGELFDIKRKAEGEENESSLISIDTELILEINNLCHFNEARKMYGLFKKYLFTDKHSGNWGILLKTYNLQRLEGIPRNMLVFHWEDDGTLHLFCFMSASDNASYNLFGFDYANTNGNDFGNHRLGKYGSIQKNINLDKIINYAGPDYKLMFRMVGDSITCGNPPLIRHKYRLRSLRIPCNNVDTEYIEKYYDLFRTGNWNARHAIERGGFNLNG